MVSSVTPGEPGGKGYAFYSTGFVFYLEREIDDELAEEAADSGFQTLTDTMFDDLFDETVDDGEVVDLDPFDWDEEDEDS